MLILTYEINNKKFKDLNYSNTRTNLCNKIKFNVIIKRTMMRAGDAARVAYNLLRCITNPNVLNTIHLDKKPLTDGVVEFSLDDTMGVVQHKTSLTKHVLSQLFSGKELYNSWNKYTGIPYVTAVEGNTDLRVINEFRVIQEYCKIFNKDIETIQANLDSQPGNFPAQKQSNQDFWVILKTKSTETLDKISIVRRTGYIPQDEKSGMGMFASGTRGTLGVLSYNSSNNQNIQIMSKIYPKHALIEHDKININSIRAGLNHDNYNDKFSVVLNRAEYILKQKNKLPEDIHNEYQQYMWDNIQTNANYNRSVSFIFINNTTFPAKSENEVAFSNEMHNLLGDKLYDLDKRGDCRAISIAMIRAYEKTIDNKIVEKINYLKYEGKLDFNKKFIEDFALYIKHHGNIIHTVI